MKSNQINEKLNKILQDNKDCDSGRNMSFRYVKIVNGFRHLAPISGYDDIAPLIKLTTRIGESGIFTSHPLIGYSLTSGTVGTPRYIPCTQEHIRDYKKEFLSIVGQERTFLLFESLPRNKKFTDGVYLDSISGNMLHSLKEEIEWLDIVNPEPIIYMNEYSDSEYIRAYFALCDADITQIFAPFSWGVINFFDCIERNFSMLLNDIKKGSIDSSIKISDELRTELEDYITPNPKRAEALMSLYDEDFFNGAWVERVWPKMTKVVAGGGGSFSIYSRRLKKPLGKIAHNYGLYASSEAVIGKAMKDNSDVYTLADTSSFFEFLPVCDEKCEALLPDELEVGKRYMVIVTNNAGLYRYKLGDVIEVVEMKDGKPSFRLVYRSEQALVIGTAKITEDQVFDAICVLEQETGIEVADYSFGTEDGKLLIILELKHNSDDKKKRVDLSQDYVAGIMEHELSHCGNEIKCVVHFSKPQMQLIYRDVRRLREKNAIDQIKPIRVLDNPIKEEFFKRMTE